MNEDVNPTTQIEKWYEIQELLAYYFSQKYGYNISRESIYDALFMVFADENNLEWQGDLWDLNISYDKALYSLSNFDFPSLKKELFIEEGIIPNGILMKYKARIKSKGTIWVIHKYDKDPFPSNPHAHQLDNNIKLDLSNGNCYKIRELIYTVKKSDLLAIRSKAEKLFDGLLPELAI